MTGPLRRQSGFTLLELIIVLVIAGFLLAVVPPLLSGAVGGAEAKDAARRVAAALRLARDQAMAHGGETTFTVNVRDHWFTVSGRDKRYPLPEKMQVKLVTVQQELQDEAVGTIRFFPDGTSTGGRVSLVTGVREFLVDIDWLTGQVELSIDGTS